MKAHIKLICQLFIILILFSMGIWFITYYHLQNDLVYVIIYNLTIDYSIILIPASISIARLFRNFLDNKQELLNIYGKVVRIRDIIALKLKKNEPITGDEHFFLNSLIITDIKDTLGKFGLKIYSIRFDKMVNNKELYHLDCLIFDLLEIINSYELGKRFRDLEKNGMVELILKNMPKDLKSSIVNERILTDLLWAITYHFFYNPENKKHIVLLYKQEWV